ncbi:MAG: alpha/beta hydrolase [bacterium]|nr:alpha/beta hydrolase [bacterium]
MKRVFIIHGWEGFPEEGWFPWLKRELEARGFEVHVPQMPDSAHPRIQKWIPAISKEVGVPDNQSYLVGHSMGCQAIVRYLESLSDNTKIGGVVFVAGFLKRLTGLGEEPGFEETEKHWLGTPIDLEKIGSRMNNGVAVFSDNDPFVPLDNQDDFRDKLHCKIIIEHAKGHFSGPSDNITELPVVLEELLKMVPISSKFK